jgi:hypothetical protein
VMTRKDPLKKQLMQILKARGPDAVNKETALLDKPVGSMSLDQKIKPDWSIVHALLNDPFFENLYSRLILPKISSKRYSLVLAVLSYPKIASQGITQEELDKAHRVAKFIQGNVRSGEITYTHAKVPTAWPISGNPGTKR